jgi:hypothetical protein
LWNKQQHDKVGGWKTKMRVVLDGWKTIMRLGPKGVLVLGGLLMFLKRKFPKINANQQIFTLMRTGLMDCVRENLKSRVSGALRQGLVVPCFPGTIYSPKTTPLHYKN